MGPALLPGSSVSLPGDTENLPGQPKQSEQPNEAWGNPGFFRFCPRKAAYIRHPTIGSFRRMLAPGRKSAVDIMLQAVSEFNSTVKNQRFHGWSNWPGAELLRTNPELEIPKISERIFSPKPHRNGRFQAV